MGVSKPGPEREVVFLETGAEPEHYIMRTKYEPIGNGNIRRKAYVLRGHEYHLVHTEIIPAQALIVMGREASLVAQEAFNQAMFNDDLGGSSSH